MSIVAAESWADAVRAKPGESFVAVVVLLGGALLAGLVLRQLTRRSHSLRRQVLAVTLSSLALGAAAAVVLGRLMILDAGESRTVIGLLAVTAVFATVLVFVASATLGQDARRLEATVRQIEAGDRRVRTGIERSDELGHVARALDELTARLDALERERASYETERATMLSSVGHDLRTPLSALRAAIEALSDGVADDPQRYLRSMQRDVEALGALVDDVFLLARIEAGRVVVADERVDLTEIADEAIEALAPVAQERGVQLRLEAGTRVQTRGSAAALGRVVRNLVDNAIRYAPAGSTVLVAVASTGTPSVRVSDEGPGFPEGFDEHAFDRFSRPDASRQRGTGGAGLGLAIARGLVEAHGGRIWIEEAPGGHVAFELPAA
jgi:signal transduction histidine kinase